MLVYMLRFYIEDFDKRKAEKNLVGINPQGLYVI